MEEIWRDVVGYESLFQVSSLGNVFSKRTLKELKQSISRTGYKCLSTKLGGRTGIYKCFKVHRLVAEAFVPKSATRDFVNHKDGNKLNNVSSNLEWVTKSENTKHAVDTGLILHYKGSSVGTSKLTEEMVKLARNKHSLEEVSISSLARTFKVNKETMRLAIRGTTWSHVE